MAIEPKRGPFTLEELLELWLSVTDPAYTQSLVQLGEGEGLEVFTQQHEQLKRVSEAIDRTMEAMFILPHSGQSDEPASGARRATVELTIERTKRFDVPVTFNELLVEEEQTDYQFRSPTGVTVRTERRYAFTTPLTFAPGETGPKTVTAVAERAGFGYNNPLPGTITSFVQPGTGFSNVGATVIPGTENHRLQVSTIADVVIPEHVGQYVEFTAGANAGEVRRVVGFEQSDPAVPHGGVAILAKTVILRGTFPATYIRGETVTGSTSGATGVFVFATADRMILEQATGTFVAAETVTGSATASAATLDGTFPIEQDGALAAEAGTAAWRILDWEDDLGFKATNTAQPTGGCGPMLDELGAERGLPRAPGEGDEDYRQRIARLPDTVSPNAVRRAGNRILAPLGGSVCLREVGDIDGLFPGQFYDVQQSDPKFAFAYDMVKAPIVGLAPNGSFLSGEVVTAPGGKRGRIVGTQFGGIFQARNIVQDELSADFEVGDVITGESSGDTFTATFVIPSRPQDRFKLAMDFTEMRAFFLVGVPPLGTGEFGIPYDATSTPINAYDAFPFLAFYDGFPVTEAVTFRSIWQAIDKIRAGGVGFDLYVERLGCF